MSFVNSREEKEITLTGKKGEQKFVLIQYDAFKGIQYQRKLIKILQPSFSALFAAASDKDKDGVPTGYTVTDATGAKGKLRVSASTPSSTEFGAVLANNAITVSDGPNVLLSQVVTVTASGTTYEVTPSVALKGSWTPLSVSDTTYVIERMSNGNYLITATISIDSSIETGIAIPVGTRGYDLTSAPKSIVTRIVLDAGKTHVLAQAVSVNGASGGAK